MSIQSAFDSLYDEIKSIFGEGHLTTNRLVILTPRILRFTQQLGVSMKLSGQEKKELFFDVLNKILRDATDLSESERKDLKSFIDSTLPFVVDAVVYAYKSKAFQHISKKTKLCWGKCCGSDDLPQ